MLKELTRVLVVVALAATSAAHAGEPLKVGTSAGPYAEILVYAGEIAAKEGIEIKTIEFSDYTMPNAALAEST